MERRDIWLRFNKFANLFYQLIGEGVHLSEAERGGSEVARHGAVAKPLSHNPLTVPGNRVGGNQSIVLMCSQLSAGG